MAEKVPSSPERVANPFFPGWRRWRDARHEFEWFKANAEPSIEAIIARHPEFTALKTYCEFYVDHRSDLAVQAGFGRRSMARPTVDGKTASETGASIVYSLGPTGMVAVMLYPPQSDLGRVREDHLYLRIRPACAATLIEGLESDLADLVAYERVASLDTMPRLGERLRIGWLRYWSRIQVDGKTEGPKSTAQAQAVLDFSSGKVVLAVLGALFKPVGTLVIIYLLLRVGAPELVALLAPGTS